MADAAGTQRGFAGKPPMPSHQNLNLARARARPRTTHVRVTSAAPVPSGKLVSRAARRPAGQLCKQV
jgi:hypothetical protein